MSSIKRDVKKKSSASTGGREDLCLDVQPTGVSVPPDSIERFCSGVFAMPVVHLTMVTTPTVLLNVFVNKTRAVCGNNSSQPRVLGVKENRALRISRIF